MNESELIVFFTFDPKKDTERAFLALTIATSALATEMRVGMFFALDGIYTATKGYLEGLREGEFAPLQELLDIFQEEGGKLYVCHPFMAKRNIAEDDLVEGVELSAAPSLVYEASNAKIITV